MTFVM